MQDQIEYWLGANATPHELQRLFAQTTWAEHRTLAGIKTMLHHTHISVAARSEDRLIGFARAITDGIYRALIDDVVVDNRWRGHGVGQELVRRLLEQLSAVEQVRLNCRAELVPFYERMGLQLDTSPQMRVASKPSSSR
jgi:predicted GNAT family N-acyltransferase